MTLSYWQELENITLKNLERLLTYLLRYVRSLFEVSKGFEPLKPFGLSSSQADAVFTLITLKIVGVFLSVAILIFVILFNGLK